MDLNDLKTKVGLKEDLIIFCRQNLPTTKGELEFGTKFEYSDKFIDFIVVKAFGKANKLEDFPEIMQDMIGDRKLQLIIKSSKAADLMFQGRYNEHPLVMDYDEKRGTLLKYNNRTLSKYLETEVANNVVTSLRENISENQNKIKIKK